MRVSAAFAATLSVFASFAAQQVSAHGYLVQPLALFISKNIDITQYSATIDSKALFPSGSFSTTPRANVASFVENFKKSSYKTIKAMTDANQKLVSSDATKTCGFTDPSKTSYGALNDTIYFGRSPDLSKAEGFVIGHEGPCETWCDDNKAQTNMNCQVAYNVEGGGAAPVPIDASVCKNAKRLTFYWIAMHGPSWQVYVNCVNINGSKGGSGTSQSSTDTGTNTQTSTASSSTGTGTNSSPSTQDSATTTNAPTTTTTPSVGEEASTPTAAPEAETTAPSTDTTTPTAASPPASSTGEASGTDGAQTTGEKCTRRMRS